jgi:hypothetical protein
MHVSSRGIPAGMGGWRNIVSCQNQQNCTNGLSERVVVFVIQISLNTVFDEITFPVCFSRFAEWSPGKGSAVCNFDDHGR